MEYACEKDTAPMAGRMGYVAVVIVLLLLVFFIFRREPAVGVRDGNWVSGVYVRGGK